MLAQDSRLNALQKTVSLLEEYIKRLHGCRFGKSTEKYIASDLQGCLFDEAELPANQAEIEAAAQSDSLHAEPMTQVTNLLRRW